MRTREDDSTQSVTTQHEVLAGSKANFYPNTAAQMWPRSGEYTLAPGTYEKMLDYAESDRGENPCFHLSTYNTYNDLNSRSFAVGYDGSLGGEPGACVSGTFNGLGRTITSYPEHSSIHILPPTPEAIWTIPDYSSEAWMAMQPEIKSRLAFLNSIYELKDFKKVYNQYFKNRDLLRRIMRSGYSSKLKGSLLMQVSPGGHVFGTIGKLKRHEKFMTYEELVRRVVRSTGENALAWKFAIEPLLTDIASMGKAVEDLVSGDLDRLLKNQNKPLRSHYRKYLASEEVGITSGQVKSSGNGLDRVSVFNSTIGDVAYTATAVYSYHLPQEYNQLADRALLDSLGIQMNPGNLWRAIRWTFVVDWFLGIGKLLDRFKARNLEPIVRIDDGSHSIKYTLSTQYLRDPDTSNSVQCDFIGCEPVMVLDRRTVVYVRKPVTYSPFSIPKTSDFSYQEMVLAGFLGAANFPDYT